MTCIIAKNDKYWYIPYVQYTVYTIYTVYIVLLLKTRHILKLFPEILQLSSSVNSPKMRISFPLIFLSTAEHLTLILALSYDVDACSIADLDRQIHIIFPLRNRIIFLDQDPYQSYSWIRTTVFKNHRDLDQTLKILKMT